MADEVASLKVLITGDAEQLQSAITQTEAELKRLGNTQASSSKTDTAAVKENTKAKKENTSSTDENARSTEKSTENISKNTKETEKNSSQHKKTAKELKEAGKSYKELGDSVGTFAKPLQTTAALTAAGGVAAVKFAMDYETAFTGVKKTVNGTDAELNKLSKDLRKTAQEIPVSASELANLAAIGGQLGVGVNDIQKFTETIAGMGVATNLAGEEGASALARIVNVTGNSMDNVDRIGSSIVALGNNSATTEREIAEMATRMGKFGNTVGINTHQVLAYSAALSSMGVEAQAGGSALGRTWLAIEEAAASGGKALSAYAKYAGMTAAEFKKQWSTDASGAFSAVIKGLSEAENLTLALGELGITNTIDQQSVMALANDYDLLTKSLELSSKAYEENNALTKEAEAAYATTANQLKIAGNNIVEAAMGIGEMLLPSVVNASEGVKEFAQGLANMDDGMKEGIITTGKWVIGLGLASKGVVGTIKGIGGVVESYANIKSAFAAGGALAKFAPMLTSVGAAAGPAALGIAAVGTAVWAGKKAYDAWYKSEYKWAEGLEEGNDRIEESLDKYKQLSGIQSEIKDLKLVIENPESSKEQVETAQKRLEEIKELLSEEYNLVINSDNSNLDEAVEKLKGRNRNELQRDLNAQKRNLNEILPMLDEEKEKLGNLESTYETLDDKLTFYDNCKTKIDDLKTAYDNGSISVQEYNEGIEQIANEVGTTPYALTGAIENGITYTKSQLEGIKKKIDDQRTSIDTAKEAAKEYMVYLAALDELNGEGAFVEVTADNTNANEVLNGTEQKLNELDGKNAEFDINADGSQAYMEIDGVSYQVMQYDKEKGTAILSADGKQASMMINLETGEVKAFDELEGTAVLLAIDNVSETAQQAAVELKEIKDKEITITAVFKRAGEWINGIFSNARGTSDSPGGLAMINDQRGVSDPRELVEVDGKGYIFEGKDVVLPLPKHSKVYTAAQTKAIMAGKGIPHYAKGKDNEAFEAAKDDWSHYTKINNVSAKEALAHWNELLEQFAYDAEAIKEIQEEIADSTRDMWDEELEAMEYALDMGWISQEEYFEKLWQYRDANFEQWSDEYKDATLKLKEYNDKQIEDARDAQQEKVENTLDFIEREKRLYGMSADEQLAILRELESGCINYFNGLDSLTEADRKVMLEIGARIDDAEFAVIDERIAAWESDAALYLNESQTLGWDWLNNGDSEVAYYQRMANHYQTELDTGGLNDEQKKDVQRKRREAELNAYSAAAAEFEDMLSEKMEEINDVQAKYSDRINALREDWDTEDRRDSIEDVQKQLSIYENAVTKEGREEYERLQEELKGLEREEQIYQLEQESAAAVKRLETEYERLEASKELAIGDILGEATAFNGYIANVEKTTAGTEKISTDIKEKLEALAIGPFAQMVDFLGQISKASENLDVDININNSFAPSDSTSQNSAARKVANQLYSLFGGR